MVKSLLKAAGIVLLASVIQCSNAVEINTESTRDIEISMKNLFSNIITRYKSDNSTGFATLGGFMEQKNVSWFGSAIVWNAVYQYSLQTGDGRFDGVAKSALALASYNGAGDILGGTLRSISEKLEGKWNDDIGWWLRAFLKASEKYGKNKEVFKGVTYYSVAKKTFKEIYEQYDNQCGGGIYWSRNRDTGSKGYAYKSTITNTIAIEAGSVLHRMSNGEPPFLDNAIKTEAWLRKSGIVDSNLSVYDGLDIRECSSLNPRRWSYNAGTFITALVELKRIGINADYYERQIETLIKNSLAFFSRGGVPIEPGCDKPNPLTCNQDISTYISVFALSLADGYHSISNQEIRNSITNYINTGLSMLLKSCSEKWTCSAFITSPAIPDAMNPYNQLTVASFLLAKHSIINTNGPPVYRDTGGSEKKSSSARSSSRTSLTLIPLVFIPILLLSQL